MAAPHIEGIEPFLTVGEVAGRSSVAVSALHFYESEGLIKSTRSPGNQRRYSRDVLRRSFASAWGPSPAPARARRASGLVIKLLLF